MSDYTSEADVEFRISELRSEISTLEERRRQLQNTRLKEIVKSLSVDDMELLYNILKIELDYDD